MIFDSSLFDSSLLRTRLGCVAVAFLLYFGMGMRVRNLEIPTGRSPDETNYTLQANRLVNEGSAGLRSIAAEYQSDPAARLAGPPTRAGYLWLLAATMRITGKTDASAGAILSCAASIGSLLMLTLIGIRFFPPWATLFALLFFIVSPAEQELARRAWTDALVGFLGLSLVYVASEITHGTQQRDMQQRIWQQRVWHWVFVLLGCVGIVVKEFGSVIFALCAIWVLWVMLVQRKEYRNGLTLMVGGLVGTAAILAWLAYAIGGFSVLVETVLNWRGAHVANTYALEYQSGPGTFLLRAFYVISPMAGVLCAVGLAVLLVSRWKPGWMPAAGADDPADWPVIRGMAIFSLGFLALPMLLPNWLNLRYVSVLFGPFYLIAGVGFWYVASLGWARLNDLPRKILAAILIVAVGLAAASDAKRFNRIFVWDGVGDLSVKLILDRADLFAAEKTVKRAPTAENYLTLCWRYEQNWRYQDSIAACQRALQLNPGYAEAYDQLAVAHVDLEMWDEAILAARRALQLNPELRKAQANLARSIEQRRLRDEVAK
ncbi:MAG: hypothetical protein EXQ56_06390 [Acidobacteria bacterium]|nr:hypothetical protein [Acidobacteriota bacterium]